MSAPARRRTAGDHAPAVADHPPSGTDHVPAAGTATLAAGYRQCRALNRRYGSTYYWSTWVLPADKRRHVHALYAFCRYADDIVDTFGPSALDERRSALEAFGRRFFDDLDAGASGDPLLAAVIDTVLRWRIDPDCFRRFLRSMTMDLTVRTYGTFDELLTYMDGSAAVIGEMMLPLLLNGPGCSPAMIGCARDLGIAFQLTNFLRDVAEDLDRDRVYLPGEDIAAFGAEEALAARRVTPAWVGLMRFEIARTRCYYRSAQSGISRLPPASARCIAGAHSLYGGILDLIEAHGYDVFSRRLRVPSWRKVAVALSAGRQTGIGGGSRIRTARRT